MHCLSKIYFAVHVKNVYEVQILRSTTTDSLLVILLSCHQIGSLSSSTANQRAAQNNYRALGCQDLYFLNFVTCTLKNSGCTSVCNLVILLSLVTYLFITSIFNVGREEVSVAPPPLVVIVTPHFHEFFYKRILNDGVSK